MARLRGRLPPLVVAPVRIPDRRFGELRGIDAVEAIQLHGDVGTADLRHVAALEATHSAVLAEQVLTLPAREAIVAERVRAGQQPECVGLDDGAPVARLRADAAIALAGALREIDVGFEAHRAAVATALVGFQHGAYVSARPWIQEVRMCGAVARSSTPGGDTAYRAAVDGCWRAGHGAWPRTSRRSVHVGRAP